MDWISFPYGVRVSKNVDVKGFLVGMWFWSQRGEEGGGEGGQTKYMGDSL